MAIPFLWNLQTLLTLLSVGNAPVCNDNDRPVLKADPLYSGRSFAIYDYGKDVTLTCSGSDAANLTILQEGQHLELTRLNSTAIQVLFKKLDVGLYRYVCVNNNCESDLTVFIEGAMLVTWLDVRENSSGISKSRYSVPRGELFDVSCVANKELETFIVIEPRRTIQTKVVDGDTVTVTQKGLTEEGKYDCSIEFAYHKYITSSVRVSYE